MCPHPQATLSFLPMFLSLALWEAKEREARCCRCCAMEVRLTLPCAECALDNAVPSAFYSMFDFLLHVALHIIRELDIDFSSGIMYPNVLGFEYNFKTH